MTRLQPADVFIRFICQHYGPTIFKTPMMSEKNIPLPPQEEGREMNVEASLTLNSVDEASTVFKVAKARLMNVNKWQEICGKASSTFQLTDEKGNHIEGLPEVGNYFKIDIPGPGTLAGEGYDWVSIEDIHEDQNESEDSEYVLIRVRPASNPANNNDNIAHFLSQDSTSNFVVKREKNFVMASVYGRNEVPNLKTRNLIDKARNAVIGISAMAGFSYPQWKSLVNGLLGKD